LSYFLDDDASQVRDLKDKLEKLQSDFLSTQFSVSQENVESGQSTFPIANPSARGGGSSGGGGGSASEPYKTTVQTPAISSGVVAIDLAFHTHTISVTEDITTINFTNPPVAGDSRQITIRFNHSGVGTRTITFPASAGGGSFTLSALQSARYGLHTEDQAVSFEIETLIGATFAADVSKWSQFPALQDVDFADKNLLKVAGIDMDGVAATIQGVTNLDFIQADQSINSLAGALTYQGTALDKHSFVLGAVEAVKIIESTAGVYRLDMLAHEIHNSREISFDGATEKIIASTEPAIGYSPTTDAALVYNTPSAKSHLFKINNVDTMTLSTNNLVFKDGLQVIFNPDSTNAGVNMGLVVGDPSSTANGDFWYNSTTNKFRTKENGVNVDVVGGVESLNDLSDATITAPSTLQVLRYNGSTWVNADEDLDDLNNVTITAPATNSYLKYNGTNWIDSLIVDGDLPSTVVHTDLVQTFTSQKTFDAAGTSLVITNRINMNGDVQLGNSSTDDLIMNGTVATDISLLGDKVIRSSNTTEIGYLVTNDTGTAGSEGTVQIPTTTSAPGTAAVADSRFGAYHGAMGIQDTGSGSLFLYVRQSDGNWAVASLSRDSLT